LGGRHGNGSNILVLVCIRNKPDLMLKSMGKRNTHTIVVGDKHIQGEETNQQKKGENTCSDSKARGSTPTIPGPTRFII
jgi:hypothetical protein